MSKKNARSHNLVRMRKALPKAILPPLTAEERVKRRFPRASCVKEPDNTLLGFRWIVYANNGSGNILSQEISSKGAWNKAAEAHGRPI